MTRRVEHMLFDANLTGGQILALRLGEALRELGWESSYVLPEEGPLVELLDRSAQSWSVVPMAGNPLAVARAMRRHLVEHRPDVVHTHLVLPTQLAARMAARSAGIPVVTHYHIPPVLPSGRIRRVAYGLVDRLGADHLSAINVAVSEAVARSMRGLGIHNVNVVPNGVVIPESLRPAPKDRTVLVLGRIARAKGQDVAVAALALLAGGGRHLRLRIVGAALNEADRAYLAELEEQVAGLGLAAQVEFAPASADVAATLAGAWCLVLASRAGEGMPLVVLEAMAAGKPVIGADVSGVPEVVEHERTGLLFAAGDAGALAQALTRLLDEPALAARLAATARDRVTQDFSIGETARRTADLYASAISP